VLESPEELAVALAVRFSLRRLFFPQLFYQRRIRHDTVSAARQSIRPLSHPPIEKQFQQGVNSGENSTE
jgi:hypothetical protein